MTEGPMSYRSQKKAEISGSFRQSDIKKQEKIFF